MNVKIIVRFLVLSGVISCHAMASYPRGCYECVEEVWEEVPCDEVPPDTTTEPPPDTTPTTQPPTTTTTESYTTTTPPPTTPNPTEAPSDDPYKKCYCECKVGCKEFCRKVVVHPEPKKQIVQVSKISEPVAQGRIESTHYHQRELIGKSVYGTTSNEVYNSAVVKPKSYDKLLSVPNKYEVPLITPPPPNYNSIPPTPYYANPSGHATYADAYAGINNIGSVQSYTPTHTEYYSAPEVSTYDFPVPFANAFSKLSIASSNGIPSHSGYGNTFRQRTPYLSPTPVQNSHIDTRITAGNPANYDDPIDSYLKEIINGNPVSDYQSYKAYAVTFR